MEALQAHVNVIRNNQGLDLQTEHNVKRRWMEYKESLYKKTESDKIIFEREEFDDKPTVLEKEVKWV